MITTVWTSQRTQIDDGDKYPAAGFPVPGMYVIANVPHLLIPGKLGLEMAKVYAQEGHVNKCTVFTEELAKKKLLPVFFRTTFIQVDRGLGLGL